MVDQGRRCRPWHSAPRIEKEARRLPILAVTPAAVATQVQRGALATAVDAALDALPPLVRRRLPRQA
ncbi:MAG: hypothetical protein K0S99_3644, partial [Thermomicrobiales bacterium]|nr:hypothetical protein [Thermomicrobiales bacterium]